MLIHLAVSLLAYAESLEVVALDRGAREAPFGVVPDAPPPIEVQTARLARADGGAGEGPEFQLVERHGLPLVRVELVLSTGALVEGGEVDRLALEAAGDLLREGPAGSSGPAYTAEIARLGALFDAACTVRACRIAFTAPSGSVAPMIALVGELVRAPAFPARPLRAWRAEARTGWLTAWQSATTVHARALARALHRLGHPARAEATRRDYAVTRTEVRTAWSTVTREASALVTVVGDTRLATIRPALESAFGWVGGEAGAGTPAAFPTESRAIVTDDWTSEPAQVTLTWPSPGAQDADQAAWQLVSNVLVGGFTSRLNLRLREEMGATYTVAGGYLEQGGGGRTHVDLRVPTSRLDEALRALTTELDRMRREGPDAEELAAARSRAWVSGDADIGGADALAGLLTASWYEGLAPAWFYTRLDTYRDVSLDQAQAAAARWLDAPRVLVVTGEADRVVPILVAQGWASPQVWSWCDAVYGGPCP